MDLKQAIANLERRGFAVSHFATAQEAADYLVSAIAGTTVGLGGSQTLEALGIYERLQEKNEVFWHWYHKDADLIRSATRARVYLTSANAIAQTGEIVNIDGRGNRIAATLYDKDAVYFVVGINKFTDDFDSALWRARNVAAPKNAQRLGSKTPCAVRADKCYDCNSPGRICRGLSVLWAPMLDMQKMEVVIIDEELGA